MAACVAAVLVSACAGDDEDEGRPEFQGTWVACAGGVTPSQKDTLVISGTRYTDTMTAHDNDVCAGAGTAFFSDSGTVAFGPAFATTLAGAPVTAYQLDVDGAQGDFYDLGYVDVAATPDRLYLGDSNDVNDGSTPALRPTALDDTLFYLKQ
jgi:hypothetical protein